MAASVTLAPDGAISCSCSVQTYAALHFMWGLNIKSDDQGAPNSRLQCISGLIFPRLHCTPYTGLSFPRLCALLSMSSG